MLRRWTTVVLLMCVMTAAKFTAAQTADFATYLGGAGSELGYAVATDPNGYIYIAGMTSSFDFPVSAGAFQTHFGGGKGDVFVTKLDPASGKIIYSTYVGGTHAEGDATGYVGGIAVDAVGNAYVTGVTYSPDFPVTPNAVQRTFGSHDSCGTSICGDAFVFKLNPAGTALVYSTYLGGTNHDEAKAITIDSTGAAYVTGITASVDFPTTSNAFQRSLQYQDAFVTKLSPDGSALAYSTLLGGSEFEFSYAIAVDSAGRAHIAGMTNSSDFPLRNALSWTLNGSWDAFVVRLNASGTYVDLATLLGGTATEQALGIAVDRAGDIYVAGYTDSPDFPTLNAFQPEYGGGGGDGFVTKFHPDGTGIAYSTYLGGHDVTSELDAIVVNDRGEAFVAGSGGRDFPVVDSSRPYRAAGDVVVAKLTAEGSGLYWSSFFGGTAYDLASGIALDPNGHVVVVGQTASSDMPATSNAVQSTSGGATDAFVIRVSDATPDTPVLSSPKLLSFGSAYVGTASAPKSLRISNTGTKTLHVTNYSTSSNVTATHTCSAVAPGTSCTLLVTLSPKAVGATTGTITLYDDAPDSPQTITITGTGVVGGDLELVSFTAASPTDSTGTLAVPFTAVVRNNGPGIAQSVTLRISNNLGGADCTPCQLGTLPAGASTTVQFTRTAAVFGNIPVMATVSTTLKSPDLFPANNSRSITVVVPLYAASAASLGFAQIVVGHSASQTITLVDRGAGPFRLSFSAMGDFSQTNTCTADATTCSVTVTFTPTTAGPRTGTLTIYEDLAGTTQTITLSGTAFIAPWLDLSASSLQFKDVLVGGSLLQLFTLTNSGSAGLNIGWTAINGRGFVMEKWCTGTLAPGHSCSVAVRFTPASAGDVNGSLVLQTDLPNGAVTVLLSANGRELMVVPARPSRSSRTTAGQTTTSAAVSRTETNSTVANVAQPLARGRIVKRLPERIARPE